MELNAQRKKVVFLASSLACFSGPGLLLTEHFKGRSNFHAFVIVWCLLMATLLVYTITQMAKLKQQNGEQCGHEPLQRKTQDS